MIVKRSSPTNVSVSQQSLDGMAITTDSRSKRNRHMRHIALASLLFTCILTLSKIHVLPIDVSFSDNRQDDDLLETRQRKIIMATYIFGKTASYAQMFVESARYSGVDVVIVGSPTPFFELPPNVRHLSITWQELVARVSARLFEGEPLHRLSKVRKYKVVDLKPFFAYLFPHVVEGYDWWGHIDNDMLLGNVRHFVTTEMLRNYDVISPLLPQDDMLRTWGPFTLYKNANTTNQLFRLAQHSLKNLLDTNRIHFLDEWAGVSKYRNSSMSGILTNHQDDIQMYHEGLPIVWDGECKENEENCAECILDLSPNAASRLSARVYCNHVGCQMEEVLLCHYQMSKTILEESLIANVTSLKLINDGRFRASRSSGFLLF
jgi:hypothetical protein